MYTLLILACAIICAAVRRLALIRSHAGHPNSSGHQVNLTCVRLP